MQRTLLSNLLRKNPSATFVVSLGTLCYDMEEAVKDFPNFKGKVHFIRGAMGCVMGIGLGVALVSDKKVIVVIGDGSFAMKMGSMMTILKYAPKNLFVEIVNNQVYASTGRQPTVFSGIGNTEYFLKHFKVHADHVD